MSKENADIVRRYFEAWARSISGYWDNPRSLVDQPPPGTREWLELLDPGFVWHPVFAAEPLVGLRECAAAWDEWLEAADDYQLELEEVTDLGGEHVLVVVKGALVGKSTGIHVDAPIFGVVTVRDGLIMRLDEYARRDEALAAAASTG
jgi:ketosteroid isomerase-like protein